MCKLVKSHDAKIESLENWKNKATGALLAFGFVVTGIGIVISAW